jgi:group I intron endonuclease
MPTYCLGWTPRHSSNLAWTPQVCYSSTPQPFIPSGKNIKKQFNLSEEPLFIFNDVNEGLEYFKTYFKGVSGIYGFVCLISRNIYIGSAVDLAKRPSRHFNPSTSTNKHLSNAINLYGIKNFVFIIIDILGKINVDLSREELLSVEEGHIKSGKNLYNILTSTTSSIGFKHTEETKKLISEFAKNRFVSDETKAKLSSKFKGDKNPFFGKSHSPHFKNMMSNLHSGINNPLYNKVKSPSFLGRGPQMQHTDKTGGKNPNAKSYKVTNINTGEFIIYPTFKEAYESVKGSKPGAYKAFGRSRGRRQGRQK